MGLISKTVILPEIKPTQVFASNWRPLIKYFLSVSEAC